MAREHGISPQRDLSDATVAAIELGFRLPMRKEELLERFESFVSSHSAQEVADTCFLDLMADSSWDELPYPCLRRHFALKVLGCDQMPLAHIMGEGQRMTSILSALGWDRAYRDANWKPPSQTWLSAANTVPLYANKSFRLLFTAPCNERGHGSSDSRATEAYMLTWGLPLLCDAENRRMQLAARFGDRDIVLAVERYLDALERYTRACYSLGNYLPAPDDRASRNKLMSYDNRPELFWRGLSRGTSNFVHGRYVWYTENADVLALSPWFEDGSVRLEGPYRFGLTRHARLKFWLSSPGVPSIVSDLEDRVRYMDDASTIVAERSRVLAQRVAAVG